MTGSDLVATQSLYRALLESLQTKLRWMIKIAVQFLRELEEMEGGKEALTEKCGDYFINPITRNSSDQILVDGPLV